MTRLKKTAEWLTPLAFIGAALLIWQAVSMSGIVPNYMLPSPVQMVQALIRDFPLLMKHSRVTLLEAGLGLLIGVTLGFAAAAVMDAFPTVKRGLYPILVITQTIPPVAIAPLLILWFSYGIAPKVVLVVLVSTNRHTMQFSAAIAILITIGVGIVNNVVNRVTHNPDTSDNLTLTKVLDALEAGAKSCITVAVACAMAGLVAGCITSTGLASKLITAVVTVSGGRVMIALVLTMLCCIVLGMGVPTTANYCIMASTCAPILITIGVPQVAAHFFVFYFGIVADITPPVALAAYAGSAIAKAPPMKTAVNATKLAIAAFVVPYIFAMNPAMLFINTTALQVVSVVLTSLVGIFGVAAALNGYLLRPMNPLVRVLFAAGGLLMLDPSTMTDLIGIVVFAAALAWQIISSRRANTSAA